MGITCPPAASQPPHFPQMQRIMPSCMLQNLFPSDMLCSMFDLYLLSKLCTYYFIFLILLEKEMLGRVSRLFMLTQKSTLNCETVERL